MALSRSSALFEYTYHSKGETDEQLTNMYCPLLYLKPWGFVMCNVNTFPG